MSIRITELDAITSLQSGDYIAVDNESTGTHKFDALNIGANIGQNIANTYSSSASYAIGQYCLYDNNLYKCTTTISTPEAWNSSHWIQVTVGEGLYEKVDKVSGKGLSTNDFTNEYKQKLGGIEAGAEVNIQANWAETNTSSDSYIQNKPGNATTETSGFMSASDKQKLNGIASGAEVNVQPNWAEDDSSKDDYIKNKPTIDTALSESSDNAVRNSAITAGINQVQGNLDTEITNRQNAVSGEQLARENADSALDGRLDTVEETLPNKANINGSYEEMTVGSAEQLISTEFIEDTELYTFRASGGGMDIGDRETDKLVGGTVAWNQLIKESENYLSTGGTVSTVDGIGNFTANAAGQQIYKAMQVVVGHKYLASATFKTTTATQNIALRAFSWDFYGDATTSWQTVSSIGLFTASGGASVGVKDNRTSGWDEIQVRALQTIDLTALFGSTIADYIYSLEQATAGSGVAWFRKYFPKPYYAYDSGSLQSVNVASHDMTGFNQWDEEWEVGRINSNTGQNYNTTDAIRSKNYCCALPNLQYFFNKKNWATFCCYDADKNYLGQATYALATDGYIITTLPNTAYFRIGMDATYGTTYNHDICINRVWTGNRNGEYEPYELHSYAYDESVELRGIPSLVDGELVYDGDTYEADGTVNRKYGIKVFDGTTGGWSEYQGAFYQYFTGYAKRANAIDVAISDRLQFVKENAGISALIDVGRGTFSFRYDQDSVQIYPTDSTIDTSAKLNTWLASNPVTVVYELATPTSEQATGFTNPQVVDAFGTEEYVDAGVKNETRDVSIPVGHVTQYMANLRDKLQHLPNLAKEDGDYFVNQTGTQMKLKKVEGYYEDLVSGMADNLTTKIRTNDQTPYLFRTAGGSVDIGDREYINGIVGGTVAFNQLIKNGNFATTADWGIIGGTITVSNNVCSYKFGSTVSNLGHRIDSAFFERSAGHKYATFVDIKTPKALTGARLYPSGGSNYKIFNYPTVNAWGTVGFINNETDASATGKSQLFFGNCATDGFVANDVIEVRNFFTVDLTLALGSTIADYVYSLEQATAGAGVAFFKSLFPKPYYAYNAGELKSVKGLVSHDMVGFNAWDEEWEVGVLNNGVPSAASNCIRSKNFCPCVGGATYYMTCGKTDGGSQNRYYIGIYWYDADKNYISFAYFNNLTGVAPSNARYFKISTNTSTVVYGNVYHNDICVNLSWDGSEDGNYEPYQKWSYPLDSDLELRGIPKLDSNNNLYYDGDTYESDGTVTRKYGVVDLGTLNWARRNVSGYPHPDYFASQDLNGIIKNPTDTRVAADIVCPLYKAVPASAEIALAEDKVMNVYSGTLSIVNDTYTDAATFKTAMSGVYLVYPLATPTTETADPYTNPQIVNDFGTEEFVISNTVDVPIPVGHNTDYPINLKSKLEMAPDSPDGDGDYIVRQTNGTNEYVPLIIEDQLPAVPSTDGTYTLTVTIASGEATYSWT